MKKLATLSWDDGGGCDGKVVAALNALHIPATWYMVAGYLDLHHTRLPPHRLPGRYAGHEIGNHTMTHPNFREIPPETWPHEITDARHILQAVFQQEVYPFAYPHGINFQEIHREVTAAGHLWARTVDRRPETVEDQTHPMVMPVSDWFWRAGAVPTADYFLTLPAVHLCGHSYELLENGVLPQLVKLLEDLRAAGFEFMTNSAFWRRTANHAAA